MSRYIRPASVIIFDVLAEWQKPRMHPAYEVHYQAALTCAEQAAQWLLDGNTEQAREYATAYQHLLNQREEERAS